MPSEGTLASHPEQKAEHHHGEQRLQHGPGRAQGGLFVAHLDIAPGQDEEQVAVFPQLFQVEGWNSGWIGMVASALFSVVIVLVMVSDSE